MRRSSFLALICAAALLVVACREQVVQPELPLEADAAGEDSVALRSAIRSRPPGPFLAPVASDSMVFTTAVDSFRVQLTNRECAAPSNWVVLTSPVLDTLSSTMCQEPVGTVWSYTDGPYAAGTAVVLDFESGVGGTGLPDGWVRFSASQSAAFPVWNLEFEDSNFNGDWNDFLLRVTAFPDTVLTLSLTADTTELHPWIDSTTFLRGDTLYVQDDRVGDSASVTVTATLGATPAAGASVVVRAEVVPGAGGHSHQADRIAFRDLPALSYAAGGPRPIGGYFKQGSTRSDSIVATTDSQGQVEFKFVAGFLGGRVDLVAIATLGSTEVTDTLKLTVAVPGLMNLVTQGSLADSVYFIGPKQPHQSDSIWWAQPEFASALRGLVSQLSQPEDSRYLRLNDASLPMGGSFSLESTLFEVSAGNEVDRPRVSHRSHAYGVDIDMSICFSDTNGKQTSFTNPPCGSSSVPEFDLYRIARSRGLIAVREGGPPHYHLRLSSETLRVPQ